MDTIIPAKEDGFTTIRILKRTRAIMQTHEEHTEEPIWIIADRIIHPKMK
jgi:hypothetical protein